jgi:NAD(P)-dependent dehydrogenase (short-subunit alcohol dehydrogenase family)
VYSKYFEKQTLQPEYNNVRRLRRFRDVTAYKIHESLYSRNMDTRGTNHTRGVALVTGASAGLGHATAEQLAADGWTVVGASRRGVGGKNWQGLVMDVDSDESVKDGIACIVSEHGQIDGLVAAAGWGLVGSVENTSIPEAKAQMETNFWGVVRVTNEVLPLLRANGGGRVVLVSSIGGLIAIPFQAYYSASKFALEGWAEALAYEVKHFNIKITLIEPGNFKTDFTANRRPSALTSDDYREALKHAIGVMGHDEIHGADPQLVAKLISKQLVAKTPRRRVSVGKSGERIGLVAKRLLPHRLFEAAAKSALGVK